MRNMRFRLALLLVYSYLTAAVPASTSVFRFFPHANSEDVNDSPPKSSTHQVPFLTC